MTKPVDITGQKFGKLIAIGPTDRRISHTIVWKFQCDCGNICYKRSYSVVRGDTKSCGCLLKECVPGTFEDLTGRKFGRLLVVGIVEKRKRDHYWNCLCDCGKYKIVGSNRLLKGKIKSCGCGSADHGKLPEGDAHINYLLRHYVEGAKNRNLSFELTRDEFKALLSGCCYYCGVPPNNHSKKRQFQNGIFIHNGIDRLDNTKGYVKGNCVSCCKICNKAKHALSLEEFTKWLDQITRYRVSTGAVCLVDCLQG